MHLNSMLMPSSHLLNIMFAWYQKARNLVLVNFDPSCGQFCRANWEILRFEVPGEQKFQ